MPGLRSLAPADSDWHDAQFDTLRLKLIKGAARVTEMASKITALLPTAFVHQRDMAIMAAAPAPAPTLTGGASCPTEKPSSATRQTPNRASPDATMAHAFYARKPITLRHIKPGSSKFSVDDFYVFIPPGLALGAAEDVDLAGQRRDGGESIFSTSPSRLKNSTAPSWVMVPAATWHAKPARALAMAAIAVGSLRYLRASCRARKASPASFSIEGVRGKARIQ